jgi:hypothetical protein
MRGRLDSFFSYFVFWCMYCAVDMVARRQLLWFDHHRSLELSGHFSPGDCIRLATDDVIHETTVRNVARFHIICEPFGPLPQSEDQHQTGSQSDEQQTGAEAGKEADQSEDSQQVGSQSDKQKVGEQQVSAGKPAGLPWDSPESTFLLYRKRCRCKYVWAGAIVRFVGAFFLIS